ncbi:MAG: bifunctional phosphopantothenoylcysteine decarboxylase/phosphopantothenate--cysteine ligase CoaBC [Marinilabiliales bacterium]|nr:MAG: bifunctional phosphopantothenoylcysteine decarboxylase/phosphopantothenate--cysteine ligase CoaBC [Marinilabiliales bacterium]
MQLKGRKIILGITGSIAAYKAAYLTRLLVREGAEVKVIITPLGKEFITPVTLATLSRNTVLCDFFNYDDGSWNSHVDLGMWADLFLVAPASANTMAKMASGICDNLLLTTYLSCRCPVMIAPAMDLDMFGHPATLHNMKVLLERGNIIIEPASGELASGLTGKGRMEEPENIINKLVSFFTAAGTGEGSPGEPGRLSSMNGRKVLVTAGPTHEPIDPVRFIGNHSSGKMGFAIAAELAGRGAEVVLVTGPVALELMHSRVKVVKVSSAAEMHNECTRWFPECDACIMAAAVADYTPLHTPETKIKRSGESYSIEMKPTVDILAELGRAKKKGQVLAGFALETDNEMENAKKKLHNKNLNFIVLNSLKEEGAGFHADTNKVTIINPDGSAVDYALKGKPEVAVDIVNHLSGLLK